MQMLEQHEALYNHIMSSMRITVEWGFGAIIEQWKFLDFQQSMKIFECLVAQYYIITAFLYNLCNCFVGSKMQSYFNAQQLTIDEYLGLVWIPLLIRYYIDVMHKFYIYFYVLSHFSLGLILRLVFFSSASVFPIF